MANNLLKRHPAVGAFTVFVIKYVGIFSIMVLKNK